MEVQNIEKLKMDTLREVADSNMLVASMKAELVELEKEKGEFFRVRENEVLARIHKLLNHSRILLEETDKNYVHVHQFYEVLTVFAQQVTKAHEDFKKYVASFEEKSIEWNNQVEEQEKVISQLRADLQREEKSLDSEREFIKSKKIELEKSQSNLESLWNNLKKN